MKKLIKNCLNLKKYTMHFKNNMFKHSFNIIIFAAIILIGCEKNEPSVEVSDINPFEKSIDFNLQEKNEMLNEYAYILAKSLVDVEMRTKTKEAAQEKFDGDYDILVNTYEAIPLLKKGNQIKDVLIEAKNSKSNLLKSTKESMSGSDFLEAIKKAFPNLQVSVPVHCDEWDTENYIPLVAFLPFDYDEHTAKYITAYDKFGEKHKLSLDVEPTEPVIVVSRSERVDEDGNFLVGTGQVVTELNTNLAVGNSISRLKSAPTFPATLTLSHGSANSLMLQWTDVDNETSYEVWRMHQPPETQFWKFATTGQNDNNFINNWIQTGAKVYYKVRAVNNDGYSSWSPIMATTVSERNDNEWLKIKRMKFSNSALKAVEKWASGAPEIRLRVVKGSETGASTVFTSGRMEPNRRKDIDGTWWNKEVQIFTWATGTYGTVFTFDWREEDWDDKAEFTINASYEAKALGGTIKAGGSVKFTGDKGGDHIGNTSVMWWHNKNQIYNLSGFEWQFVY